MRKSQQIGRIILDILCIGLVFLPWICIQLLATPYQRGFFCDDESISHPYKDSTITTEVLTVVGLALPIISFLITEAVHFVHHRRFGVPDPSYMVGDTQIPFVIYQYYKVIGVFLFGAAFQQTVVNIAKYSIGRLRPHFFAVCKPDYTRFNCTDSRGYMTYVEGDYCTGTDEEKLTEMRLSFMSGHASFSSYSMVFLALYLHGRVTWRGSKLLRPLLQCVVIMMALYCSLSRISDYKHHWSDVLAGALFGTVVASISVINFTNALKRKTFSKDKESLEDLNQELEQVDIRTTSIRPTSNITYIDDNLMSPQNHTDSGTGHRNHYTVHP